MGMFSARDMSRPWQGMLHSRVVSPLFRRNEEFGRARNHVVPRCRRLAMTSVENPGYPKDEFA